MTKYIETPISPRKGKISKGWDPSNIYPFFPTNLFVPDHTTKEQMSNLRSVYKSNANANASNWATKMRKKGFAAKIVTHKDSYEVLVRRK